MPLTVDLHVGFVQVPREWGKVRMRSTRWRRISAPNIGLNLIHQNRTISWQMSMPRSCSKSSALRKESGQHHRQANHFGTGLEAVDGGV